MRFGSRLHRPVIKLSREALLPRVTLHTVSTRVQCRVAMQSVPQGRRRHD